MTGLTMFRYMPVGPTCDAPAMRHRNGSFNHANLSPPGRRKPLRLNVLRLTAPLVLLAACMTAPSPSPTPDSLVLTGGTVWAGPSQIPTKGLAILIRDGRIVSLVPDDTIPAAFASARRLDVGGATILPGLVDAHGHLDGLGEALENVDLTGTTSYEEVIARIALRAAQVPEGTWILGRGWDQNDWTVKEFPTAPLLDASVPRHPVWVSRIDGHAGLAEGRGGSRRAT